MIPFIEPDWPAPIRVRALTTTRAGGVSAGCHASLNLGAGCGDDPDKVAENRRRLRRLLPREPRWLNQVHGKQAVAFGEAETVSGADAIVAREAGEVCAVLTADCLPVLLASGSGHCVAAAHAGWRGLAAGVLESAIELMAVPAGDIVAWLGPGISSRHYQVGEEVRRAFIEQQPGNAAFFVPDGKRWKADLAGLARRRLLTAGVANVYGGDRCTFSEREQFFSYRRDGRTGRMASAVWLE